MITHIVFFKLKDRSAENIAATAELARGLAGKVPQLRRLEIGVDVLRGERSYDLSLLAEFDSLAELGAYQVHPYHREVVAQMRARSESIVAVDYEKG